MSKLKVHRGASKRFKKTGNGLKRKKSNKSHILTKMTTKRKRQLRGTTKVAKGDQVLVDRMLKTKSQRIEMERVKRGVQAKARHNKVLKQAKGTRGARSHT